MSEQQQQQQPARKVVRKQAKPSKSSNNLTISAAATTAAAASAVDLAIARWEETPKSDVDSKANKPPPPPPPRSDPEFDRLFAWGDNSSASATASPSSAAAGATAVLPESVGNMRLGAKDDDDNDESMDQVFQEMTSDWLHLLMAKRLCLTDVQSLIQYFRQEFKNDNTLRPSEILMLAVTIHPDLTPALLVAHSTPYLLASRLSRLPHYLLRLAAHVRPPSSMALAPSSVALAFDGETCRTGATGMTGTTSPPLPPSLDIDQAHVRSDLLASIGFRSSGALLSDRLRAIGCWRPVLRDDSSKVDTETTLWPSLHELVSDPRVMHWELVQSGPPLCINIINAWGDLYKITSQPSLVNSSTFVAHAELVSLSSRTKENPHPLSKIAAKNQIKPILTFLDKRGVMPTFKERVEEIKVLLQQLHSRTNIVV